MQDGILAGAAAAVLFYSAFQGQLMSNKFDVGLGQVFDAKDAGPPKNVFEAAQRGDEKYIAKVAERTVEFDVNKIDEYQRTALHWAAELGRVKAAEVLLDYGANLEAAECNGRTPIHLAARAANAEMLETLLENADAATKKRVINQTDKFGITAVYLVLQKQEEGRGALEVLVRFGAKITSDIAAAPAPSSKPETPSMT